MKSNAVILMYHRVLPKELMDGEYVPVQPGMYVTPASLRLHLSYLKAHFSIITLSDLVNRLKAGKTVCNCAVITFDDGWLDNYLYAFPILKELKIPATIFLASGFIGTTRWFWPEEISWAVLSVLEKKVDISLLPDKLLHIVEKTPHTQTEEFIDRIIAEMKLWKETHRISVAKDCSLLREKVTGESQRLLMNWEEVKEMSQSGLVDFGAHTVSHAMLNMLPPEKVQREIYGSVTQIFNQTGLSTDTFAYPNGNYTKDNLGLLPQAGIAAAVTTKRGFVNESSPLLELPRIAIHEDISHTQALFQWRLFVR
ncbi:MAG: polysaccharide deacetylase family protein [Desulforhopalus sp.]